MTRRPMQRLLEVDVTRARQHLRTYRERTRERLSLTAFLIACLARAVDDHREVQAFRRGRRLVVFDEVDGANPRGGRGQWKARATY